jgi:predicted acylesterase/phospholipase RssA
MTNNSKLQNPETPLFLVLDGGGARGIAHVAMWRALEPLIATRNRPQPEVPEELGSERYRLAGIAGTSAGAIAAAFIAAGASADDLIDESGRPPLCTELGLQYFHALFGIRGWRHIQFLRLLLKPSTRLQAAIGKFEQDTNSLPIQQSTPSVPTSHAERTTALPAMPALSDPPLSSLAAGPPEAAKRADQSNSRTSEPFSGSTSEVTTERPIPDDKVDNPEPIPNPFDVLGLLILFSPISPLLFFGIRYGASKWLQPPYSLLLLMLSGYAAFFTTSQLARWFEARRTSQRKRGYSKRVRRLLHPFASVIYAVILATAISILIAHTPQLIVWHLENFGVRHYVDMFWNLTEGFWEWCAAWGVGKAVGLGIRVMAWALFGLSLAYAGGRLIRAFIKGGIDTESIENDLNSALYVLLTRKAHRWDQKRKRHDWKMRERLTDRQRMLIIERHHVITFEDIHEITGIQLCVVAADAIRNRVVTYSYNTHPDLSVAKAVTASLSIPFAFRFVRHRKRLLVDGGLVSTIPAWVFRRERNRDPDCKILAVRIEPSAYDLWIPNFLDHRKEMTEWDRIRGHPRAGKLKFFLRYPRLSFTWPFSLFVNYVSTALFGARALELDASDRLETITLAPQIGLLDFDAKPVIISKVVNELARFARPLMEDRLWRRQLTFNESCADIERRLKAKRSPEPFKEGTVRMFWAQRDGTSNAIRIRRTYNFHPLDHLDDRLLMPYRTSMSALAFETGKSQFGERETLADLRAGRINRYRAAAKWQGLLWCWAIPVFRQNDDKHPAGVLAIESDIQPKSFGPDFGEEAKRRSEAWPRPLRKNQRTEQATLERQPLFFEAANGEATRPTGRVKRWERKFADIVRENLLLPHPEQDDLHTEADDRYGTKEPHRQLRPIHE